MYARLRRFVIVVFSAVVFGAGVLGWYVYLHYTDPETIRQLVMEKIQLFLPKARISLESAEGQPFGGVRLRDFVFQHEAADGSTVEVLRLPAVYLTVNRHKLLEGTLGVDRVVLDQPTFHFHRDETGRWNVADWISGKQIRVPSATEVVIRNGRVKLTGLEPSMEDVELEGLQLKLQFSPPAELTWEGICRHVLAEELRTSGSGNLWTKTFHAEVAGDRPVALDQVVRAAPPALQAKLPPITNLRGQMEWKAQGDIHQEAGQFVWDGVVDASIHDAGFEHPRLPYPVSNASGALTISKVGVEMRQLQLSLGPARGKFDGEFRGFDFAAFEGVGELRGLPFSEPIYQCLGPKHRLTWDRFSPRGSTDLKGRIRKVGGKMVLDGSAHLQGAELCFNKFPYPVKQVKGRADLHPEGNVAIELEGRGGDSPVILSGRISDVVDAAKIEFELSGKGLALDKTFEKALAPDILAVYKKFQLQGKGDFVARIGRSRAGEPVDFSIEADVSCDHGRCEWFPYDLERITGRLSITPYRTDFREFKGFSRGGVVEVEGRSIKTAEGSHLEVRLHGADMSLDEKLRTALAPEQREVWDSLRPEGRIEAWCSATRGPDQELDLKLTFDPAKTVITPAAFPYRLERFAGRVEYHQRKTWWKDIEARHGDAVFRCNGQIIAAPERISVHLTDLVSDQALLGGDLRQAVPEGLQTVLAFLEPSRPVAVRFKTLDVGWNQKPAQPTEYAFDGELAFRDVDLVPAIGAKNATGRIVILGRGVGEQQRTIEGNLGLTSINIAGFTATNASGRLEVHDHDVKLSNIRADIYDGQVIGSVKATCGATSKYECVLDGYNSRLGRYVRETSKTAPTVDGLVDFRLFMHGSGMDKALQGGGRVILREADIQGLPIVQDLFRLLSFQAPTGRAFDEVDCNFRFDGRKAIVQKLELLGPAEVVGPSLSLFNVGEGSLDLDTLKIQMTLAPRFARGRWKIPVLTDFMNAASDNLVEIPVGGTLHDPVPLVDTLPGLRRAFEAPARLMPFRNFR